MSDIPPWKLDLEYVEACNCEFGCPCNFNGYPTGGKCESMVGLRVRHGHFGGTALDGLAAVLACVWPRAIHQGEGRARIYIDERATPDQRKALLAIFSGEAGGDGPFALLMGTFVVVEDPIFTAIAMRMDGRRSAFSIPGVLATEIEPFTNPVTGLEQDVQVHLPQGFIFKTAQAAKSRVMKLFGLGPLSFDHSGRNAFYAEVSYAGP